MLLFWLIMFHPIFCNAFTGDLRRSYNHYFVLIRSFRLITNWLIYCNVYRRMIFWYGQFRITERSIL